MTTAATLQDQSARWRRRKVDPLGAWALALRAAGAREVALYQRDLSDGHLTAIITLEEPQGWHISVSHRLNTVLGPNGAPPPGRLPTWDELRDARYRFVPDGVLMVHHLPPPSEYVNLHETTLHLWECRCGGGT